MNSKWGSQIIQNFMFVELEFHNQGIIALKEPKDKPQVYFRFLSIRREPFGLLVCVKWFDQAQEELSHPLISLIIEQLVKQDASC